MEVKTVPKLSPLEARLSKKVAGSAETRFAVLKSQIDKFRQHLGLLEQQLVRILSEYQSYATSRDEFERIYECLDSIDEIRGYFGRKTGSAAVFFPLNMPLYALILYGIFPALFADRVYIRAPQRMTDLMRQLLPVLELGQHFPNIEVVFASREEFVDNYVSQADIVVFTGKLENAQYVLSRTKKNSLFLFNGWGCNPIVVSNDADLELAANKTIEARLFSSGQDCAGPDMVLVPRSSVDKFVAMLKMKLANVKIGPYSDYENTVGPMSDSEQLRRISSIFIKSCNEIVYGGEIDFATSTVHPTVIVSELSQCMNFTELFAPVLYLSIYEDMNQLKQYFENPRYIANEMYVTLFGHCDYVENLKRSIIVKDRAVFDIDRGNDEFGGFSMGASFVASNHRITPKPVLVPRDISDYLQPGSAGYKLNPSLQKKISKHARKAMTDCFSSNMVFGFVFGSIARGEANGASDINTMIILESRSVEQVKQYTSRLHQLHEQNQLKFKDGLSVLAKTMQELNEMVVQVNVSTKQRDTSSTKDLAILVEALSGLQCGVSGDKGLCVEYGRRVMKHSKTIEEKMQVKSRKSNGAVTNIQQGHSPDGVDIGETTNTPDVASDHPSQIVVTNNVPAVAVPVKKEEEAAPDKDGHSSDGGMPRYNSALRSHLARLKQYANASKRKLLSALRRMKTW